MLASCKRAVLQVARAAGAMKILSRSGWRNSRLLIVAWHGISIDDEHEWSPGLFMSAGQFTRRLQILRDSRCNVLSLKEGLGRLRAGTLPERSVCLTFDDGFADFALQAAPILNSFGFPVTLYFTTQYLDSPLPVFPNALAYLAWTKRQSSFGIWRIPGLSTSLDFTTEHSRSKAVTSLLDFAERESLSLEEKDRLLISFADRIETDHRRIRKHRMLHQMNGRELKNAARQGVDVQLHTHSHSVPADPETFREDLHINRTKIEAVTGTRTRDFCYPSGIHFPHYASWLRDAGIRSAVTCERGLASRADDTLVLPRYSDGCGRSEVEFESWLSGLATFIPAGRAHRRRSSTAITFPEGNRDGGNESRLKAVSSG
jgi:peptidoglycan/xylan/chitin deacetylase (PgdA/CDA1 family)